MTSLGPSRVQMSLEVAADNGNRARVAQKNAEIRYVVLGGGLSVGRCDGRAMFIL